MDHAYFKFCTDDSLPVASILQCYDFSLSPSVVNTSALWKLQNHPRLLEKMIKAKASEVGFFLLNILLSFIISWLWITFNIKAQVYLAFSPKLSI